MLVVGLALLAGVVVVAWRRVLVKVGPDRALVRTGRGGACCFLDGTAVVLPLVHNHLWISLQPVSLTVGRRGDDALFSRDCVRLDARVEFVFQVPANRAAVLAAARCLGPRGMAAGALAELLQDKLECCVRSAAAQQYAHVLLAAPAELARAAAAELGEEDRSWLALRGAQALHLDLPAADTLPPEPINRKTLEIIATREREGNLRLPPNADSDGATSPDGRCRP